MLGPENATTRSSRFYHSTQPPNLDQSNAIISTLGEITNQLSSVQASITSLNEKVDVISEKTSNLTKRVAAIEEVAEKPPAKKRKVQIPPDLSVRFKNTFFMLLYFFLSSDYY